MGNGEDGAEGNACVVDITGTNGPSPSPFISPFDVELSRSVDLAPAPSAGSKSGQRGLTSGSLPTHSGAAAGMDTSAGAAPGNVGAPGAAESGALGGGLPSCHLGGTPLGSVRYASGGMAITNSAPIPTLLPPDGECLGLSALCNRLPCRGKRAPTTALRPT